MSKYHGITHGQPCWGWWLFIRRKLYCSRNIHLFDEVIDEESHYLSCDACDLMVYIDKISTEYVL